MDLLGAGEYMSQQLALELKNIRLRYINGDGSYVLDDINAQLEWGKIYLLAGASGSGKSSLISLITGMAHDLAHVDFEGELIVDGHTMSSAGAAQMAHYMSCVLQNPDAQIIHAKVEDEIALSGEIASLDAESISKQVDSLCELFALDPLASTQTLSGGQKERLCIASVLACKKPILILDEPLASLDRVAAQIVLSALVRLRNEGMCIIIAEHRFCALKGVVDEVFMLNNGQLSQVSPTSLNTEQSEFVEDYECLIRELKQRPSSLDAHCQQKHSKKPVMTLKNIKVLSRSKHPILDVARLDLYAGELILLVGDNGAGKSTLMHVIADVVRPQKGGQKQLTPDSMRALVWQVPEYQMFATSVEEEMALRSACDQTNSSYLEQMGLKSFEQRHPLALSEGQKRRLMCAATWAVKPEILLMDEPFAGQDHAHITRQLKCIQELVEQGSCTILSTHDLRGLKDLVTRIIWLDKGRIVADEVL